MWSAATCAVTSTPAEQPAAEEMQQESSTETPQVPRETPVEKEATPPADAPSGLAAFDTRRRSEQTPRWIDGHDPEYFTLQIISVGNEDSAKRLLESIAVRGRDKGYVGYELEGSTRYGAFIGIYRSYTEAERALQQLPPHIQEYKPWIRNVKDVQRQASP